MLGPKDDKEKQDTALSIKTFQSPRETKKKTIWPSLSANHICVYKVGHYELKLEEKNHRGEKLSHKPVTILGKQKVTCISCICNSAIFLVKIFYYDLKENKN